MKTHMMGCAQSMIQSFKPLSNICQHVCGIHTYNGDTNRQWPILISPILRLDAKPSRKIIDFISVLAKNQVNYLTSSQFLGFCVLISLGIKSTIWCQAKTPSRGNSRHFYLTSSVSVLILLDAKSLISRQREFTWRIAYTLFSMYVRSPSKL